MGDHVTGKFGIAEQQSVSGGVCILLRLEGLCVLIAASITYHYVHPAWSQFFWLFFLPDISFLGYLAGKKWGAFSYNALHSYVLPLMISVISYLQNIPDAAPFLLIWIAHIGFDRAMGYGLKYSTGFGDTHLGKIGKSKKSSF